MRAIWFTDIHLNFIEDENVSEWLNFGKGKDAQLDAAIAHLKELIEKYPVDVPEPPPYPDKTFKKK